MTQAASRVFSQAGAGRRSTPKSAETRSRIVRGALLALERHGLTETTTRRIAAEADVRLATLHYHFASKDAVLLAVLEDLVTELTTSLHAGLRPNASLEGRVGDVIRSGWAYALETRSKQIVQYELTLYALRSQGTEWLAHQQYEAYVGAYEAVLAPAGAAELAGASLRRLAAHILAGMDGLILQHLVGSHGADPSPGVEALIVGAQAFAALVRS